MYPRQRLLKAVTLTRIGMEHPVVQKSGPL
jgi:hypothetical protein